MQKALETAGIRFVAKNGGGSWRPAADITGSGRLLPSPQPIIWWARPQNKRPLLKSESFGDILVSMTRNVKSFHKKPTKSRRRARDPKLGQWLLQDAKARFSELVRRVRSEGPQRVTVHGRDEVVVISAEEFRRLKGDLTGAALIVAMQASPHRDIDIEPGRSPMPTRKVSL